MESETSMGDKGWADIPYMNTPIDESRSTTLFVHKPRKSIIIEAREWWELNVLLMTNKASKKGKNWLFNVFFYTNQTWPEKNTHKAIHIDLKSVFRSYGFIYKEKTKEVL